MPDIKAGGPSFWADQLRSGAPDYTVGAQVLNGGTVPVRNSLAADSHNATAVVTGSTLTGVDLASTVVMVDNADTLTQISDSTNVANGRVTGTATVAAAVLSNVQLPTTAKIIKTAVAYPLSAAPTGAWVSQITFTINASGVITAAVLS
ncbi:hypothetical protein LJR231_003470 [Phyllobacterium sp. LjRoot231]|uniref:hypothetical protein n=1 Tax=Phyllobacterium sp. LjRoot231 TaxID=3342289 RepID=UPI003ECC736E